MTPTLFRKRGITRLFSRRMIFLLIIVCLRKEEHSQVVLLSREAFKCLICLYPCLCTHILFGV